MNICTAKNRERWLATGLVVFTLARGLSLGAPTANPDSFATGPNSVLRLGAAQLLANDIGDPAGGPNTNLVLASVSSTSVVGGLLAIADPASTPDWTNRYDGPGNGFDEPKGIAVDAEGNILVTGLSTGIGTGTDYATIKYSPNGVPIWTNRFNGPGNGRDIPTAITVDHSGNVCVTGYSTGSGTDGDHATVKYRADGMPLWTNRYNGAGNADDQARAIAVDGSGNVIVTGFSLGGALVADYTTIKYLANGVPAWTNHYDGPFHDWDEAAALAVDRSGNIYVTGYSTGSDRLWDWATIKYRADGTPVWTNRYGGPGTSYDGGTALAVDAVGNVYVTGHSEGIGTAVDYTTLKYMPDGTTAWTNRYDGSNNDDYPVAIAVGADGSVVVTGYSKGSDGRWDYATIRYLGDGTAAWTNRYSGLGGSDDLATALAVDDGGNVFVTGRSRGLTSAMDFATIQYRADGALEWTRYYNGLGNGNDGAEALALDADGGVVVAGYSRGVRPDNDWTIVRYSTNTARLLTYTPPQGFVGTDTFSYVLRDSLGREASGMVAVRVVLPQRLTQLTFGGRRFGVLFGDPIARPLGEIDKHHFEVQTTADFVNWVTLTNTPAAIDGQLVVEDPGAQDYSHRFYRVIER